MKAAVRCVRCACGAWGEYGMRAGLRAGRGQRRTNTPIKAAPDRIKVIKVIEAGSNRIKAESNRIEPGRPGSPCSRLRSPQGIDDLSFTYARRILPRARLGARQSPGGAGPTEIGEFPPYAQNSLYSGSGQVNPGVAKQRPPETVKRSNMSSAKSGGRRKAGIPVPVPIPETGTRWAHPGNGTFRFPVVAEGATRSPGVLFARPLAGTGPW
ncbi:hypothetical protein SRO_2050 [Streptomyces rochei]|nr:hypothetical protein SRO_2050 [Streptomyces rochei]